MEEGPTMCILISIRDELDAGHTQTTFCFRGGLDTCVVNYEGQSSQEGTGICVGVNWKVGNGP